VREGIVKHSREVERDADPELQEFLPGERPALEAQLLDIADEIAYGTADLDDSFTAGLISFDDLRAYVPESADWIETTETRYPGASDRVRFWEVQRHLMNTLIGGFIEGTAQAAAAAGVQSSADVRALDYRLAQFSPATIRINANLKTLLTERAYSCEPLVKERARASERVRALFEFLLERPEKVSPGYREHLEDTPVHRVVCDYIAGMTDAYVLRKARDLGL